MTQPARDTVATGDDVAAVRAQILADPGLILDDRAVMRALLEAERGGFGRNVVDLRGVLVDRLEDRLDRLEDTHREVIAAAYENVAGTAQVHRAALALLDAGDFGRFLEVLARDVARILGIAATRLALEAPAAPPGQCLGPAGPLRDAIIALPEGGAAAYAAGGRAGVPRPVTLRSTELAGAALWGEEAGRLRSEAVMMLDLGPATLPGLLLLGACEADRFDGEQGTDLLAFFASVVERLLRRWLA